MRSPSFLVVGAALSCASLGAQTVHLVDGIRHRTIDSAYLVAAPDDVILVRLPSVPAFHLQGKGVAIRSEVATLVLGPSSIDSVPSRQTLRLESFRFQLTAPAGATALTITSCPGAVVLHELHVDSTVYPRSTAGCGITGLRIDRCSCVIVELCRVLAGDANPWGGVFPPGACGLAAGEGLRVLDSNVSFFESIISGGMGSCSANGVICPSSAALFAVRSVIASIRSHFFGSTAFFCTLSAAVTLQASKGSFSASSAFPYFDGDAASTYMLYGRFGPACGAPCGPQPRLRSSSRLLPELRVNRSGTSVSIASNLAPPHSLLFLTFSARPAFFDFEPSGSYGALLLSLDHTSGLLQSGVHDAAGHYATQIVLPAALASNLGGREIYLQSLCAFSGRPWLLSNLASFHLQ